MSKASVSEILLTIGVLICVAILLIQIQQIVKLKTKSAEAESIYMLGRDLEMLIDKTKIMDFAVYSYKPKIKHYTLEVEENKISVKDKISGHVYYFYVDEKIEPAVFEESEDICVVKQKTIKSKIKIFPSDCSQVSFDFEGKLPSEDSENINYDTDCPDLTDNCATGEILLQKIACEAKKAGVPGNIMIGIAKVETGLRHCDKDGRVILGDGGNSIGLMQVSKSACTDPYNINENIRCSIRHLKNKCEYSKLKIIRKNIGECDPTGYCTEQGVKCVYCYNVEGVEPKVYTGWSIAIRGYNGWGGCKNPPNYNYVENVMKYASEYYQYA